MTIDVNPNAPIKDLKKEIDARANLRGKQKRLLLSGLFLSVCAIALVLITLIPAIS